MRPRLTMSVLMTLCMLACGGTAEVLEPTATEPASEPQARDARGANRSIGVGVCRAFGVPEGLESQGRTVDAGVPGELQGTLVGEELPFAEALAACVQDPACDGIVSQWYVGMPWRLVHESQPFEIDDNSYACSVTVGDLP